jgi:hypothetical protein
VFVLGMHRAGTSAFAGAISRLGVSSGSPAALKQGSGSNEEGFWELAPLVRFNDELLAALGGSWASPPVLPSGWHRDARLDRRRERARQLFAELQPTRQWVWKDPRNSLLLRFWTGLLDVVPVLVLCHRNPLEIQRSLAARDGMSKPVALALWERYMRAAVSAAEGLPALLLGYSELLADPVAGCRRLRRFLERHLVECSGSEEDAASLLRRDLRHSRFDDSDAKRDSSLSRAQVRLNALLADLGGEHDRFPAVDLPEENAENEMLLSARRDADLKVFRAREEIRVLRARDAALREKLDTARERAERYRAKLRQERDRPPADQS